MEIVHSGFQIVDDKLILTPQVLSVNTNENYYRELKKVLKIHRAENISLIRGGALGDGGYVMANSFYAGGWHTLSV